MALAFTSFALIALSICRSLKVNTALIKAMAKYINNSQRSSVVPTVNSKRGGINRKPQSKALRKAASNTSTISTTLPI